MAFISSRRRVYRRESGRCRSLRFFKTFFYHFTFPGFPSSEYLWQRPTMLAESSIYFIFSLGSLRYSNVYRRECGRCRTLLFFLTFLSLSLVADYYEFWLRINTWLGCLPVLDSLQGSWLRSQMLMTSVGSTFLLYNFYLTAELYALVIRFLSPS